MRNHQREFLEGAQQRAPLGSLTCAVCGFTSENRKLFKRDGDGHTCTTGHYQDDEGQEHRARNPYARF